jgi:hypothetical protein
MRGCPSGWDTGPGMHAGMHGARGVQWVYCGSVTKPIFRTPARWAAAMAWATRS